MPAAATYARSSKDRSDVSIAAQNRALDELARNKQLPIVSRYEDAVQRGSTDNRPDFQRLIADIKRRDRGWSHLLVYDTSRVARGRYIAQAFKHQCRKYGVEILYARIPETDPVSAVILEAVFEAMDEVHSLMSRDKALAGMAENVRRGFRAGGRAPWGYDLKREATGVIRDGKPVEKSRLTPNGDADLARAYLTARAAGTPRARAARDLGVTLSATSLVGIEWNALTYSGATVWNRHSDKRQRGSGQPKRRGRADWQITEGTHAALITRAQAEAILGQLETSPVGRAVSDARRAMSAYLLSEVLYAPDGRRWAGAGRYYRLRGEEGRRGKWVPASDLERAVLARARADFRSGKFVERLLDSVHRQAATADPAASIGAEIAKLERQKAKAARLALEEDGSAFAQLIPELSRRIEALRSEAGALAAEGVADASLRNLTAGQLKETLIGLSGADDRAVAAALQRVVLDPATLHVALTYRLSVASPRHSDRWTAGVPGPSFGFKVA